MSWVLLQSTFQRGNRSLLRSAVVVILAIIGTCLCDVFVTAAARETSWAATQFSEEDLKRIRRMSPLPALPEDLSNAVANDKRAAEFGRLLFFDPRLSNDSQTACSTCHDPCLNWTDGRRTSDPDARFPKNVPSLWNTAFNRWYFWDGRADSAWAQALGPIEQEGELGSSRLRIVHFVRLDPTLRATYTEIFGPFPKGLDDLTRFPLEGRPISDEPEHPLQRAWASMSTEDRQSANDVFANLGKAVAAFERRIVARNTHFDRFIAAFGNAKAVVGDKTSDAVALGEAEIRGLKLFIGKGNCTLCHSGPLLSDGEFHDVGIALGDNMRVDPGRHRGVYKLLRSPFTRIGRYADTVTPVAPINFLEQQGHQLGQFKTPSLRGVADTAPYMHDGRFATLEEVVRFYSTRVGALPLGHPTTLLQPLGLSDQQIADLVAFLKILRNPSPELKCSSSKGP